MMTLARIINLISKIKIHISRFLLNDIHSKTNFLFKYNCKLIFINEKILQENKIPKWACNKYHENNIRELINRVLEFRLIIFQMILEKIEFTKIKHSMMFQFNIITFSKISKKIISSLWVGLLILNEMEVLKDWKIFKEIKHKRLLKLILLDWRYLLNKKNKHIKDLNSKLLNLITKLLV